MRHEGNNRESWRCFSPYAPEKEYGKNSREFFSIKRIINNFIFSSFLYSNRFSIANILARVHLYPTGTVRYVDSKRWRPLMAGYSLVSHLSAKSVISIIRRNGFVLSLDIKSCYPVYSFVLANLAGLCYTHGQPRCLLVRNASSECGILPIWAGASAWLKSVCSRRAEQDEPAVARLIVAFLQGEQSLNL